MTAGPLSERRILAVEDEYYLAMDLEADLKAAGALVIGPAPSVEKALALIASEPTLDAAILDINLGGQMAHPVAEALRTRGVPFVITTGYTDGDLDVRYPGIPRCEKPIEFRRLLQTLLRLPRG